MNEAALLRRIASSQDGLDFIDYLTKLSVQNYNAFKSNPHDTNEYHKGYAVAVDTLIEALNNSLKEPKQSVAGSNHWK